MCDMTIFQDSRIKGLMIQLSALIVLVAGVLVSCSRQDIESDDTVTLYPVVINSEIETTVTTRAASDYTVYSGHRQNIYAEAVAYEGINHINESDASGWFLPDLDNPGKWFSRLNVRSGKSYYLYCYTNMPVDEGNMPTFTFTNMNNVTLTFTGFDIITTIDPLVTTASMGKLLCDAEYLEPNPSSHYPTLTDESFGKFDIGEVKSGTYAPDPEYPSTTYPASTKVFLALDHLFAKATLSFKVDDNYNSLRTIKLIEAKISTTQGLFHGSHTYSFVDRKFTLDGNGQYQSKNLEVVLLDAVNGPSPSADVPQSKMDGNMVTLDNDATQLGWYCFLPRSEFPALNLTVKYNVYDKQGNLVRENCIATNNNLIRIPQPEKGKNYKITVNIIPTYLYQLSDGDVELKLTVEDS